METIEQLKLDNAKLTERLNNAAKFFKEQKAQIEALTKENEELKTNTGNNELVNAAKELEDENVKLQTQLKEQQDSYENKITLLEEDNIKLGEEAHNFNKLLNDYRLKLQQLENDIDSKDKAYKLLQNTYNELFAEKEEITNQYEEQNKLMSETINTKVPELMTKLNNSESAYEELRKKYNEIKELHDNDLNKYEELENKINDLETTNNLLNQQLNDLEERYNKSKDDTSKEKQQLEIQINNHLERISQLENTIKSLNIYKEFVEDINKITKKYSIEVDYHKQVEQKENKRMGSQYESKGFSL